MSRLLISVKVSKNKLKVSIMHKVFLSLLAASTGLGAGSATLAADTSPPVVNKETSPAIQAVGEVNTLEQAMGQAYLNNPDLDAARANQRGTDETVAQAISSWRPQVTGQLNQFNNRVQRGSDPEFGRRTRGGNIVARQNLFAGGGTYAATQKAENDVLAGRFDLLSAEQQTLLSTVQAYTDVLTRGKIVELLKENEKFLENIVLQTKARYEVGEVTRTEVAAAEAKAAESIARRVSAEGELETARATFAKVIGRPPGNLIFPTTLIPLPKAQPEAIKMALKKNPALESFAFKEKSSEYNVDVQIAPLLPSLDLSAEANRTNTMNNGTIKDLTARIVLTVPIYDQGLNRSQIRQAEQGVAAAKLNKESARLSVIENTTKAWASYTAAQQAVAQYELQVTANTLALEGVREEYSLGMKSLLDVLQIEDDWRQSVISLAGAKQNVLVSSYQLLAATGQLTVASLNLNVPRYDPEKYYNEYSDAAFSFGSEEDQHSFPTGAVPPPASAKNNPKVQG